MASNYSLNEDPMSSSSSSQPIRPTTDGLGVVSSDSVRHAPRLSHAHPSSRVMGNQAASAVQHVNSRHPTSPPRQSDTMQPPTVYSPISQDSPQRPGRARQRAVVLMPDHVAIFEPNPLRPPGIAQGYPTVRNAGYGSSSRETSTSQSSSGQRTLVPVPDNPAIFTSHPLRPRGVQHNHISSLNFAYRRASWFGMSDLPSPTYQAVEIASFPHLRSYLPQTRRESAPLGRRRTTAPALEVLQNLLDGSSDSSAPTSRRTSLTPATSENTPLLSRNNENCRNTSSRQTHSRNDSGISGMSTGNSGRNTPSRNPEYTTFSSLADSSFSSEPNQLTRSISQSFMEKLAGATDGALSVCLGFGSYFSASTVTPALSVVADWQGLPEQRKRELLAAQRRGVARNGSENGDSKSQNYVFNSKTLVYDGDSDKTSQGRWSDDPVLQIPSPIQNDVDDANEADAETEDVFGTKIFRRKESKNKGRAYGREPVSRANFDMQSHLDYQATTEPEQEESGDKSKGKGRSKVYQPVTQRNEHTAKSHRRYSAPESNRDHRATTSRKEETIKSKFRENFSDTAKHDHNAKHPHGLSSWTSDHRSCKVWKGMFSEAEFLEREAEETVSYDSVSYNFPAATLPGLKSTLRRWQLEQEAGQEAGPSIRKIPDDVPSYVADLWGEAKRRRRLMEDTEVMTSSDLPGVSELELPVLRRSRNRLARRRPATEPVTKRVLGIEKVSKTWVERMGLLVEGRSCSFMTDIWSSESEYVEEEDEAVEVEDQWFTEETTSDQVEKDVEEADFGGLRRLGAGWRKRYLFGREYKGRYRHL